MLKSLDVDAALPVSLMPDLSGIPARLDAIDSRLGAIGTRLDRNDMDHERIWERLADYGDRIGTVEDTVRTLTTKVDLLLMREVQRDPKFVDHMRAVGLLGGNPYDPKRRNELLDKYVQSMMTLAEAEEFHGYLEEDLRAAPEDKKALVMWAIMGVEALMNLIRIAQERQARTAN